MRWSHYQHTVTSAEETAKIVKLTRFLRNGNVLKIINLINEDTYWLPSTVAVYRIGTTTNGLSLFHRRTQTGKKDVHWEGSLIMKDDFRKIIGTVNNPVVADVIHLTVGYE